MVQSPPQLLAVDEFMIAVPSIVTSTVTTQSPSQLWSERRSGSANLGQWVGLEECRCCQLLNKESGVSFCANL